MIDKRYKSPVLKYEEARKLLIGSGIAFVVALTAVAVGDYFILDISCSLIILISFSLFGLALGNIFEAIMQETDFYKEYYIDRNSKDIEYYKEYIQEFKSQVENAMNNYHNKISELEQRIEQLENENIELKNNKNI